MKTMTKTAALCAGKLLLAAHDRSGCLTDWPSIVLSCQWLVQHLSDAQDIEMAATLGRKLATAMTFQKIVARLRARVMRRSA